MSSIITVDHLSKEYQLSEGKPYYTLRDNLTQALHDPLQLFKKESADTFWALKDLNFNVEEGEILGVLGNNGAGKSTLLKVLSRITPPTQGEIMIKGRLGSLLEVGTGFHPELSGRENIFLNGAILGMSRLEVQEQFDTIVEFAEVEKFLDTPMKHYSSGMYMRLAFAVAAHLQSEIILVDEVLAVGDIEFQKKCLGKMGDIAKQGRTILFVSHNMGSVQQLCSRCIVMNKGELIYSGKTHQAIGKYLQQNQAHSAQGNLKDRVRPREVNLLAKLEKIEVQSNGQKMDSTIDSTQPLSVELTFKAQQPIKTGLYIAIKDENRRPILFFSSGHLRGKEYSFTAGKHTVVCQIDATRLASGRYSLDCGLMYPNREVVDMVEDAISFNVTNSDPYKNGFDFTQQFGTYHVNHKWELSKK